MSDTHKSLTDLSPEQKRKLLAQLLQKKASQSNLFPLSFAQQRLWIIDQLQPGNLGYNMPMAARLKGVLNQPALERSLNEIVRRHEALRTTFTQVNGQPFQCIAPTLTLTLPFIDLQELPSDEREVEVQQRTKEEAWRSFDLARGPLLRGTLLKLDATEHVLLFTMHHIISDGWSMGVLLQELAVLYEAFCQGKPPQLPKLPIQYADFAVWQRQWLNREVLESQLAYWKQHLSGTLPILQLQTRHPRSVAETSLGAIHSCELSAKLCQALQLLSRQANVTLFITLLAGFKTLLHRYTGQVDILVGTDVANRNRAEIELLIGLFVNILVLRTDLSGNPTFLELLKRVSDVALGAYAHQDLPFAKLVEELQPERHLNQTPLFQVLFVLDNTPMSDLQLPNLTMSWMDTPKRTAKFDLALFVSTTEQGLLANWHYNTDLFDTSTIVRMSQHFETLLNSIVGQPDARIDALEMLTEAEKKKQAIAQVRQEENKLKKFKNFKPKPVRLPQGQLVETGYLQPGQTFPLLLKPGTDELDLIDWVRSNREFVETQLLKHGAILWRGFNIDSVSAFENLAQTICPELFEEYGDLPRAGVSGKVYSSTPYPPDRAILFHNESSHLHRWPLKIWFYCVQPSQQGGETPIVDCRNVYQLLDPKLRGRLEQKQLMYVRNYIEGLDVSWQDFFRTTDALVVENYCREAGIDFEWLPHDGLRTRKVRPAIVPHPKTGEFVFFNQVQLHHVSCLDAAVRESLLSMYGEENLPRNVYYGDGSVIEDAEIAEIGAVYQQAQISFPWQKGDVLMLDNMLAAHGRNPYVGSRQIVVAMGDMVCNG